jgi:hypothetical protein
MPVSVKKTQGRRTTTTPLSLEQLPVELYVKLGFRDSAEAAGWCEGAVASLEGVVLSDPALLLHRVVIWGPSAVKREVLPSPNAAVFISEVTARLLRALGRVRLPQGEVVSLSQLEADLKMYLGSTADEQAYRVAIRARSPK